MSKTKETVLTIKNQMSTREWMDNLEKKFGIKIINKDKFPKSK